jgi:lysophospholipase L1-like esterase
VSARFSGWRASLALAATVTVVGFIALALVGEWAIRYRERHRTTTPGTMSKLFYRHNRLGHALVRGSDYFGWVHVGRQGFRGERDITAWPADSVIRIIAVGGSTTFDGNTSGDSSAWPARLERELNATLAGRLGRRFEVLNAGVPGYAVFDDLVRLEFELFRFHPDVIILYQGHNDLFYALGSAGGAGTAAFNSRPDEIETNFPFQRWLEQHSLLFHKLRSRLEAIQIRSAGRENNAQAETIHYGAALADGVERVARDMRAYLSVANSWGINVVVPQVVYAARVAPGGATDAAASELWARAFLFAPRETVWTGYARVDSVARAAATALGALHVAATDSSLWLMDAYVEGDPIHFNDRGAERWARHLSRFLAAQPPQFWIRKRPPAPQ